MTESGRISPVVADALQEALLLPRDSAAAALAMKYAELLDADPSRLPEVGPKLLQTLTSLGMTPAGRGAKEVTSSVPVANPLQELRAKQDARAVRAD